MNRVAVANELVKVARELTAARYPFIEQQKNTTKHPFIWRVFVEDYSGGKWAVYSSIDESKVKKALAALKRHKITTRREYKESPVYRKFIMNGANIA